MRPKAGTAIPKHRQYILINSTAAPFPRCIHTELFGSIGLTEHQLERVQKLIFVPRAIRKGERLFRDGQSFGDIFAVRSGSFKSSLTTDNGREQVIGFHLPGDFLGLQGIAGQRHACDALALEDAEVCAMRFEHVETLSRELPPVQHLFYRLMSSEILRETQAIVMLGSLRAEGRVAAFLLDLLDRLKARGFSETEMVLRMTREDIGSFLGLKLETVSRVLAKLSASGLIRVDNRHVRVLQREALAALAKPQSL